MEEGFGITNGVQETSLEESSVEEGVMGAGKSTGQRFREVPFLPDPNIPQFEIHLRWGITASAKPKAPPDRRGKHRTPN